MDTELTNGKEIRMVSTYRPVEIMLAVSRHPASFFDGKAILNSGAGQTKWQTELRSKYGVRTSRFVNFDLAYADLPPLRRVVGEKLYGEKAGDVRNDLLYPDGSFDFVWASFTVENFREFWRVLKPGGEAVVLKGKYGGNWEPIERILTEADPYILGKGMIWAYSFTQEDIEKPWIKTDPKLRKPLEELIGCEVIRMRRFRKDS